MILLGFHEEIAEQKDGGVDAPTAEKAALSLKLRVSDAAGRRAGAIRLRKMRGKALNFELFLHFWRNFGGDRKQIAPFIPNLEMTSRPPADALPALETTRWVARRKALLVAAVRDGRITLEEARRRYALSIEEFLLWQRAIENTGVSGLRASAARGDANRRQGRNGKAAHSSRSADEEEEKTDD